MAEPKWLPGPWGFSNGYLLRVTQRNGAQGVVIAGVHRIGRYMGSPMVANEVAIANGHLIAAAPELYGALQAVSDMLFARPDMVAKLHPLMGPAEHAVCDAAAKALAKARGET